MPDEKDEMEIQEKIRKILANPPEYKIQEAKDEKFVAWVKAESERRRERALKRKTLLDRVLGFRLPSFELPIPIFMRQPAFARVAASLFIFILAYNYLFTPQYPVISNVKGAVKICRAGTNEWFFVEKDNMRLKNNDILKTFDDGQADIVARNNYHLRLASSSEITIALLPSRISPRSIQYDLAKGKVFAYYNGARLKKKEFNIFTPEAEVSVLGTDFMVSSMPMAAGTFVGVLDGIVKVRSVSVQDLSKLKDAVVYVEPGEKTTVTLGNPPSSPQRLMENDLLELEELYRIGTKPQVALLISTGKSRVRELLSLTPIYISSENKGALPEKIEKIARQFNQVIRSRSKERHLANVMEFEEIVNKYPDLKYDVQLLLFIGAYYKNLGEHNKAVEVFNRIIDNYRKSNLLSIAQCAIGIIYEENLHDMPNAKLAYQKVIDNYPRSPEIDEAAAGLRRASP